VVLRRVPLSLSLREEFFNFGRKFVPGRNWGGKAVDEKTFNFYYIFIQHMKTAQRGWFRWEGLRYERASCFNCSDCCYKRVCLVHNYLLFLDVGSVKFLQLFFCDVWWGDLTVFEFVWGNMKKTWRTTVLSIIGGGMDYYCNKRSDILSVDIFP